MAPATDAYTEHVRSEAYRHERAAKAEVILALCGRDLERARRVADLGAGTGLIKKAIEDKLGKYLYGFDMDREFMVCRRGMVLADATRLPVRSRSFDFLLLNHLYEHVEDQEALFREAFRALEPGGRAYVSAGNRLALIEPHYRLPFLSWLPRRAADLYLRASGRGRRYADIRFRTRGALQRMMEGAGFQVKDLTEPAVRLAEVRREGRWGGTAKRIRALPGLIRRPLLHWIAPQWFFLLRRPEEPGSRPELPTDAGSRVEEESGHR